MGVLQPASSGVIEPQGLEAGLPIIVPLQMDPATSVQGDGSWQASAPEGARLSRF